MKEYGNSFINKNNDYNISVSTNKNIVNLGIDMGLDGYFAELTTKETENLITMLKEALKKAKKQS